MQKLLPYLSLMLLTTSFCQPVYGEEDGFTSLFNGRDLRGWIGATDQYRVEDGLLVLPKGRGGKLLTEKQFDNFILRFDFKLTSGANNGLAIRAPIKGDAAYNAIELQILDNSSDRWPNLKPYQTHGSIYGVAPAKRGFLKPVGEWNAQEVRCNGRTIHVILNGHTILNANLDQVTSTGKTIDGQPHPGLKNTEGHLGFLGHGDRVAFRNIRIRPLNPDQ
ncbi:MAG: DUF1080 domain-containing protein [Pirellulales bacterium]|nr:DUF1080 domain-containing protein [Pirellulales bacterium]